MASALPLRGAIRHGALLTLANWPIVLIDLVIESLFKFTVAVPIIGGAFMAATLFGHDVQGLLNDGLWVAANELILSFETAPAALVAFALALGLAAAGGSIFMYIVKSGTLAIIVSAEAQVRDLHALPVRVSLMRQASAFSLGGVMAAAHRFRGRSVALACGISAAYGLLALGYFAVVSIGLHWAAASSLSAAFPGFVLFASVVGLVSVAIVNLAFDVVRVVVVTDDVSVRAAFGRARRFLIGDARHVLGVYAVMLIVSALGIALSLAATALLALVAWVPVAGLLMVPLQILFWIARAALFQFLWMAALAAYQTQYRRFARPAAPAVSFARLEA